MVDRSLQSFTAAHRLHTIVGSVRRVAARSILLGALVIPAGVMLSTSINAYMMDTFPGHAFPPEAPYWSHTANAVQVFGQGSLGCASSEASIESAAANWVASGFQTAIEIAPQTVCGSLSQYESLISTIANYMTGVPNQTVKWGGFMLDEEPNYGFSASQLESLNTYVDNVMINVPGMAWYWVEGQPNGWSTATYAGILGNSWPASQAYTASMIDAINAVANQYGYTWNMLTIGDSQPYPYDDYVYVADQVVGTNWSSTDWGSGFYWDNQYVYPYW